jgi:hypothetical protein
MPEHSMQKKFPRLAEAHLGPIGVRVGGRGRGGGVGGGGAEGGRGGLDIVDIGAGQGGG